MSIVIHVISEITYKLKKNMNYALPPVFPCSAGPSPSSNRVKPQINLNLCEWLNRVNLHAVHWKMENVEIAAYEHSFWKIGEVVHREILCTYAPMLAEEDAAASAMHRRAARMACVVCSQWPRVLKGCGQNPVPVFFLKKRRHPEFRRRSPRATQRRR